MSSRRKTNETRTANGGETSIMVFVRSPESFNINNNDIRSIIGGDQGVTLVLGLNHCGLGEEKERNTERSRASLACGLAEKWPR